VVAGHILKFLTNVLLALAVTTLLFYVTFGVLGLRGGLIILPISLMIGQLARGRIYRVDTYLDALKRARRARVTHARFCVRGLDNFGAEEAPTSNDMLILEPFFTVDGANVRILGWRSFGLVQIGVLVVLVASVAFLALTSVVSRLFALVPLVVLGWFVWGLYQSTKTQMTFMPGAVRIDGILHAVDAESRFIGQRYENTDGIDDEPGHTELWLTARSGEVAVALMNGSVDIEQVVDQLNDMLEEWRPSPR